MPFYEIPQATEEKKTSASGPEGINLREGPENPEGLKRTLRIIAGLEVPSDMPEMALAALGTMPAFLAGGAGAVALAEKAGAPAAVLKIAPMIGRMMTAGGLSRARGDSAVGTALDVAGAGVGEAGTALIGKLGGKAATGLARIKELIGKGPEGKTNLSGLEQKLANWAKASTPAERKLLETGTTGAKKLDGIVPFLEKIDSRAGEIFKEEIAKGSKIFGHEALPPVPLPASKVAKGMASPPAKALADAALSQPVPAYETLKGIGAAAGHLPLVGGFFRPRAEPGAGGSEN